MLTVQQFYHKDTNTLTYLAFDPTTREGVVIDPVMDFDPASGRVSDRSLKELVNFIEERRLRIQMILETHAHADHLSGAQILKRLWPKTLTGIGARIVEVQKTFASILGLETEAIDSRCFDRLFHDGDEFKAGSLDIRVIATPGHTPACVSYLIGDCIFTGDCIFMPDSGTGRCDFPGGSAAELFHSISQKLYALPSMTKIYVGHDYQPGGRTLAFQSTIGDQKANNIHIKTSTTEADFIQFRLQRDKTLSSPRLLYPSLQVNIRGGHLPSADDKGRRFLLLPLVVDGSVLTDVTLN